MMKYSLTIALFFSLSSMVIATDEEPNEFRAFTSTGEDIFNPKFNYLCTLKATGLGFTAVIENPAPKTSKKGASSEAARELEL